jgi:hypothetical protein
VTKVNEVKIENHEEDYIGRFDGSGYGAGIVPE